MTESEKNEYRQAMKNGNEDQKEDIHKRKKNRLKTERKNVKNKNNGYKNRLYKINNIIRKLCSF